jgi:hypothetical protein
VLLGTNRCTALAVLALAGALSGCGDAGWEGGWFRKPVDVFGHNAGYQYSDLAQGTRQLGPVTPADLVDASGSCPAPLAPAQPPPGPGSPAAAAPPPAPDSLLGSGVGLGMTECEVVYRAGPPNSVQLGANPNGDRTAVLSYQSGPRPGIYHFERGRLMQMDRVEVPEPPPVAKKKPAKAKKPPTSNHPA